MGCGVISRLNARIDVIRQNAEKYRLAFPVSNGGKPVDHLIPYLVRVSEHLPEGHVDTARLPATTLASDFLKQFSKDVLKKWQHS